MNSHDGNSIKTNSMIFNTLIKKWQKRKSVIYRGKIMVILAIILIFSCNSSNLENDINSKRKEDAIKAYEYLPKSLKRELSKFVKSNDSIDLVYKRKGIFFENYNVYRIDFLIKTMII